MEDIITFIHRIWTVFFVADVNPIWTFFTFQWGKLIQNYAFWPYMIAIAYTIGLSVVVYEWVRFAWWLICMAIVIVTPILWLEIYLILLVSVVPASWILGWFIPHKNIGFFIAKTLKTILWALINEKGIFGYWKHWRPLLLILFGNNNNNNNNNNSAAVAAILASRK
jgi:hypothetical protein